MFFTCHKAACVYNGPRLTDHLGHVIPPPNGAKLSIEICFMARFFRRGQLRLILFEISQPLDFSEMALQFKTLVKINCMSFFYCVENQTTV